eukprot:757702-Pyramimonas_sp.AAC.1
MTAVAYVQKTAVRVQPDLRAVAGALVGNVLRERAQHLNFRKGCLGVLTVFHSVRAVLLVVVFKHRHSRYQLVHNVCATQ